jgi:hypothetical protein
MIICAIIQIVCDRHGKLYDDLLHHGDSHWFGAWYHYSPYFMLVGAIQLFVSYFYTYYELRPDALYCKRFRHEQSIPYSEIENITAKAGWGGNYVKLRYSRGRELKVVLETPFTFFDAIVSHAPEAESQPAF